MKERLLELARVAWSRVRGMSFRKAAPRAAVLLVALLAGIWLTFPLGALLEKLRRTYGSEGVDIQFDDASMGLVGPTVEGLQVSGAVNLRLDELNIRPSVPTLWFSPGVYVYGELNKGWLWLESGLKSTRDVEFAADEFDVLASGLGAGLPLALNLSGMLAGQGDFVWSENPADISGEAWLQIREPVLFGNSIPLPTTSITFKEFRLEAAATAGVLEITRMSFDGEEMWGTVKGTIEIDRRLSQSKADLRVQLYFNEALDNALGPLLSLAGFRKEKDAYVRQYRGPLNRMRGGA